MGAEQKGMGALCSPAPMLRQKRKRRAALIETSVFQRRELKRPRHDQNGGAEYPGIRHQVGRDFYLFMEAPIEDMRDQPEAQPDCEVTGDQQGDQLSMIIPPMGKPSKHFHQWQARR